MSKITSRPRHLKKLPAGDYDPTRRLVAAVVLQAAYDYLFPDSGTAICHQKSAEEFLYSEEGFDLLVQFVSRVGAQSILFGEKRRFFPE